MFARNFSNHSSKIIAASFVGGLTLASMKKKHAPQLNIIISPFRLLTPQKLAWCDPVIEEAKRVYIGLSVRSMMDQPGMMVLLVNTESPAWHADMKVGDILLEIDGKPINKIGDLHGAIAGAHGKTLAFKVNRKGQEITCFISFPETKL